MDFLKKTTMDNLFGRLLINQIFRIAMGLLEQIKKQNQALHFMGSTPKVVNVVASREYQAYKDNDIDSPDEEIYFLLNQMG